MSVVRPILYIKFTHSARSVSKWVGFSNALLICSNTGVMSVTAQISFLKMGNYVVKLYMGDMYYV